MEFFDKKPDIIRAIVSQPDILLFTTMHGIAKIVDRYGDALRCRLALIEDGCYKIYQPKVASEAIKRTYQQNAAMCFHPQRPDICFSTDIRQASLMPARWSTGRCKFSPGWASILSGERLWI